MKKRFLKLTFGLISILTCSQSTFAQYSRVAETMLFGYRMNSPIVMDVQKSTDKVSFNVNNKSYFPYDLTIKFSDLQNLLPQVFERSLIVPPGYNNLFVLNIADKEQSIQYEYSISYSIKLAHNPDLSFPYIIPVGSGKTVKLESIRNENGETFLLNYFKMDKKDTVFAIRKGTVTALPDNDTEVERIVKSSSLEILHGDGTVALYRGLDPAEKFLRLGQTVYPGQPVGIMDAGTLILNVVAMEGSSTLKMVDIYYSDQSGNLLPSNLINGKEAFFPFDVLKRELTAKEIKKYEKRGLYKNVK
jgi:hypothetical protein